MTFEIKEGRPYVCGREVTWANNVVYNGEGLPRPPDWEYEHWNPMRVRGFHVHLENGLVLSTQFGDFNYCANYEVIRVAREELDFMEACPNAELACWWDVPTVTPNGERRSVWDTTCAAMHESNDMLEWPVGDCVIGYFHAQCWWPLVEGLGRLRTGSQIKDLEWLKEMVA